jgi:hypothetical protein
MANLISSIKNESTGTLELRLPGYNPVKIVTIAVGATVDLLSQMSVDTLEALQLQLISMIAAGVLSSQDTTWSGVVIGHNDNATSLRVSGPDFTGNVVRSYSGIFYDNSYTDNGSLKTRFITGGNEGMDVELQSTADVLISAVSNGSYITGILKLNSSTNVVVNARTTSDTLSVCQLLIDRVDVVTQGTGNTSDVNLNVNTGNLRLLAGNTTGAVILPTLTDAERGALTPVDGMVFYNSDTNLLNYYNGSAWRSVDNSAV